MAFLKYTAGLVATAALVSQPCRAADPDLGTSERRGGAFAGVKISMPVGWTLKSTARLHHTSIPQFRDTRTGEVPSPSRQAVELGASTSGKPMLFVAGQSAAQSKKMGLSSTGTTILMIAGVVLVGVLAAATTTNHEAPNLQR